MRMDEILGRLAGTRIIDELGKEVQLRLEAGLSTSQVASLEKVLGLRLPLSYQEFLLRTNGCDLCGLTLLSAADLRREYYSGAHLLPIHAWGNGDFDCLDFGSEDIRPIVFMNHGPDVIVRVAGEFSDWLARIVDELITYGFVAHPRDYRRMTHPGVYSEVLRELIGVDCELNRE